MPETDVYPSLKQQKLIHLSICDCYSPKVCGIALAWDNRLIAAIKVWVAQTHFFPLKNQEDFIRIHESLREGLKRTLDEIPALYVVSVEGKHYYMICMTYLDPVREPLFEALMTPEMSTSR